MNSQFFVITGASGAGKSTLIAALNERGYSTVPEAALAVLREQLRCERPLLPQSDRVGFMKEVLARSILDYEKAEAMKAPVFFDRGIPEWVRFLGEGEKDSQEVIAQHRYSQTVFVAEPWPEIYVRDHERAHTFDAAAKSFGPTISAYARAGYETCVIPQVPVQERVAFLLAQVGIGA